MGTRGGFEVLRRTKMAKISPKTPAEKEKSGQERGVCPDLAKSAPKPPKMGTSGKNGGVAKGGGKNKKKTNLKSPQTSIFSGSTARFWNKKCAQKRCDSQFAAKTKGRSKNPANRFKDDRPSKQYI